MNCHQFMFARPENHAALGEEAYLLHRARASLCMAQNAADPRARLAHYEMAGRYSVAAVRAARDLAPLVADWAASVPELAAHG